MDADALGALFTCLGVLGLMFGLFIFMINRD